LQIFPPIKSLIEAFNGMGYIVVTEGVGAKLPFKIEEQVHRNYFFRFANADFDSEEKKKGPVAQLGERYNGIVEAVGSIPIGSTWKKPR